MGDNETARRQLSEASPTVCCWSSGARVNNALQSKAELKHVSIGGSYCKEPLQRGQLRDEIRPLNLNCIGRSSKGPTGGFALRVEPSEIRLLDIVEALDGLAPYQQCASGLSECSDDMPCSMHDSWVALRSRIMDYLGRNTIADLARALDQKKKLLAATKTRKVKRAAAGSKKG